jgi:hypothetical protein
MSKVLTAVSALVPLALGWITFAFVMPAFNAAKTSGRLNHGYSLVLVVVAAHEGGCLPQLSGGRDVTGLKSREESPLA